MNADYFSVPRSFGLQLRVIVCGLGALFVSAGMALAEVPEPDAVVYGKVRHRFVESVSATEAGELSVVAKLNGSVLAEYPLVAGADTYVLRIPMDDGREPRLPNTAKAGDRVRFFVRNNVSHKDYECVESYVSSWVLPNERAPLLPLDLCVEASVAGAPTDTDGDGLPDYWENRFGLNVSGHDAASDADGDGMSNLDEFLAGTDPVLADSKLLITLQKNPNIADAFVLCISPAISDRAYSVQVSGTLRGDWTEQSLVHPSQTGQFSVSLSASQIGSSLFFRVVVLSGGQ